MDEKHGSCVHCGRPVSWYAPRAHDYWVHDHNDSPYCVSVGGTKAVAESKGEAS